MQTYVSMLRGINVGGHKKIKMADLRELYASLGLTNVQSYVQSGNVVFDSAETNTATLIAQIEQAIETAYGFAVPVLIRTAAQLEYALTHNPYLEACDGDTKKLYVLYLDRAPSADEIAKLVIPNGSADQVHIDGDQLYIFYAQGAGRSKVTTNYLERKLGLSGTMRNWRSTNKLFELASTR